MSAMQKMSLAALFIHSFSSGVLLLPSYKYIENRPQTDLLEFHGLILSTILTARYEKQLRPAVSL